MTCYEEATQQCTESFKLWLVRSPLIRECTEAANTDPDASAHTPTCMHTCGSLSSHNMYTPITGRGRGLGTALPMTLFQDRLMRYWIAPADQITPFWPSLPGLKETCKRSAQPVWHVITLLRQQSSSYLSTFPQWKRLETAEPFWIK